MLNKSFQVLPVPEIVETNLNHSFKFNTKDEHRRVKKPPKLFPKENSFIRNSHHEVHAVSFRDQFNTSIATSTPRSRSSTFDALSSSFYDKTKNDSYYEQCFETICKLGEGSFGEVYKVRCRDDGKFYAIKKMKQIFRSENHRRERLEEVKRYEQFSNNEHCVTLYKAWEQDDLLFMQIELCSGSVEDYIEKIKHVPESFVWSFLLDMLLALKSLHDKNLIHLDIKLDNILVTEENKCKLADFGLVFDLTNSSRSRAIEGDSRYLAPELLRGDYCLANDIFSLGTTLLELSCNLELPMNGTLWQELRSSIFPEEALSNLSQELQTIIRTMMQPDPLKRPTVNSLLRNRKLLALNCQRKAERISKKCMNTFISGLQFIKSYFVYICLLTYDFFKLKKSKFDYAVTPRRSMVEIRVQHYDEDSDDGDSSFKTSLNLSRVSQISHADDDNNNESNVTPILNNSIPRITPELVNSTPLNHYNHQDGLSSRKFRRDLTKHNFDTLSPLMVDSSSNKSKDRETFICKKLCFQDEDLDDL